MGNTLNSKKANGLALIPFLIFIVVYMGAGLIYQAQGVEMAFYQFPSVTAMFLAVLVAFIMFKGSINEKFDTFAKGAANVDVLTMLIIYILAGAFATVAAEMGGRDATVNLGLSLVPVQFLAAGLFIIGAFMGTATGTSMGTISAITPIAVGVAEKGGLNLLVVLGAVIGGAMFGDNLSMISDTTIAATRSQHCEMRDKFRVNFMIALPAAILTIVVLLLVGRPETVTAVGDLSYSFIKVIPYLLVLILALVGMNVFLVLFDKSAVNVSQKLKFDIQSYIDDKYSEEHYPSEAEEQRARFNISGSILFALRNRSARYAGVAPDANIAAILKYINKPDFSFSQKLFHLIDERGMTDPEVYMRANVSKQVFSKIRRSDYHPKKNTILALAVALKLSLEETNDLLSYAGYTLSRCDKGDLIVSYYIEHKIFDVDEINVMLLEFDQTLLGSAPVPEDK